ncbi:MAG: aspartate kinase [Gemmatimonadota bacterium]
MLIVQKYGGTSVGSAERIRAVADRVVRARRRGDRLVVVVSAMGDSTDDLVALAADVVGHERAAGRHPREMDMLLTAGERISMALLAMAIREAGEGAVSLTGSQAAIITDGAHTAARITEVRGDRVRAALDQEQVVIVAGFQGVSPTREITTLGRGGSDTTAVALAAALGADRCEIYSDVAGVFTADPRRVATARVVPELSYDEMLELASAGAQVMHGRAVEIAARFDVDLRLGSAFGDGDEAEFGTLITRSPDRMEELVLTGIAAKPGQAKLTLHEMPAGLRTVTAVLVAFAEAGVSVDMISEAAGADGRIHLQLTLSEADLEEAARIVDGMIPAMGGGGREIRRGLSRIALVGSGMHQRPGVYARAYRALLEQEIDVFAVSTSGISITLLVETAREGEAVQSLHDAFTLDLIGGEESAVHAAGEG